MENYLKELNDAQRDAVLYNDGPSLIIAGAGSGKTRVLTYKIAYLLENGVPPHQIMALTFTNKAASEMKDRIAAVVGSKVANRLWMGTFHSIFSRILRAESERLGFTPHFTIYDTSDAKSLVKSVLKEMQLDDKVYKPNVVLNRISSLKNGLVTPNAYFSDLESQKVDYSHKIPQFKDVYALYAARCKASNAMDFDDLLLYTNILFRDFPEVLAEYQACFSFLLIDEYQDTNFAQHLIVSKLAQNHQHICVVGDDAQSIYSFRGANIDNILSFQQKYKGCRLFKLEQNYRSTQTIVDAANSLIEKNERQIKKRVFSKKDQGSKIDVISSYTDFDEAIAIVNKIVEMVRVQKQDYSDFAVLYRTNAQSRVLEGELRKRNVPYKIYGGLSFYQRKEIKDALAYFRLTVNGNDEESFRRIINYPARGIGETSVARVLACARTANVRAFDVAADPLGYRLNVNGGTAKKMTDFSKMMESFSEFCATEDAYAVSERIIRESGMLADISSDDSPECRSKKENLEELLNAIHEFCDRKANDGESDISLPDFLSEVSLFTDQDNEKEEDKNRVTLMTIHAAKGLEFKNVFIAGLEEQLFPLSMCETETELEEERRLFYVALTRAQENCVVTYAKSRFRNGQTKTSTPSRFLKDIDQEFLSFPQQTDTFYGAKTYSEKPITTPVFAERTAAVPSNFKKISELSAKKTLAKTLHGSMLQVGSQVEHATFGLGTVLAIEGDGDSLKAKIEFEAHGVKQLLLKYAKLTITGEKIR